MASVELTDIAVGSPPTDQEPGGHTDHHGHVAHHFDSAQQQFDACKLGMWLFLVTEVLFFSGLFVAYAVYRANHPEVFVGAHKYLNTTLGALNTIVLLVSSLTMAWAVRSAQLEQRKLLVVLLGLTLACASLFLGVKAVEYSHKWGKGLLWASSYVQSRGVPTESSGEESSSEESSMKMPAQGEEALAANHTEEVDRNHDHVQVTDGFEKVRTNKALMVLSTPALGTLVLGVVASAVCWIRGWSHGLRFWCWIAGSALAFAVGVGVGQVVEHYSEHSHAHVGEAEEPKSVGSAEVQSVTVSAAASAEAMRQTGVFFSIYYAMTGVHAVHILCGMAVIAWLLWRAIREEFTRHNFGPVDFVGLYWHLVDLVWIYLFPLLYLIR